MDAADDGAVVGQHSRVLGQGFNLLKGLVSSDAAARAQPAGRWCAVLAPLPVIAMTTPGEALVWWLLFGLLGLLLGVVYLTLLARRLPIGGMAGARPAEVAVAVLRHWLQVCGFVVLVFLALVAIYVPISLLVGLIMVFSPALARQWRLAAGGHTGGLFLSVLCDRCSGDGQPVCRRPSAQRALVRRISGPRWVLSSPEHG